MSDTPTPDSGPHADAERQDGPPVIGKIGVERRAPGPPSKRPPRRRYRRLSGLACSVFFLAGILGGASVALLFLGNRMARQATDTIQPSPEPPPSSMPQEESDLAGPVVVIGPTATRPDRTPEVLEAGAEKVYCFFDIPDEPASATVTARWLRGADPPMDVAAEVIEGEADHLSGHFVLPPPSGSGTFTEGIYEVQLLVDGLAVTDVSFVMVKGAAQLARIPGGMERYRPNLTDLVVSAAPPRGRVKKPFVLPADPQRVQANFSYSHAVPGTAFTVRWLYEDGLIAQATTEIDIRQESGKAEAWLSPEPEQALPNGKYGVEISIAEGTPPLARTDFWIGRRPRPDELKARR